MRLHRLYAILLSFTITAGSLACPTTTEQAQAAEQEPHFVGLDAEYHTQDQIRDFYKSHPIKNMEAEFSEEPSVTIPYSLGQLTEETKQDALNMLNLFRYVAGVPAISISETAQNYAQAAALVTAINREVSHVASQPQGMSNEMYAQAVYGTENSNLAAGGNKLCETVIRYMLEINGDVSDFGHRRQLLDYYNGETGFGLVTSVSGGYYSATYIDANLNEDKIIAYPGQNQPLEYFGPGYAWTVVVPEKVDESMVAVKLTDTKTGQTWTFDEISERFWVSTSFKSSCIIFSPFEIDYRDGDKYKVEIAGINQPVSYEVNLFLLDDLVPLESISCDMLALYAQEGTTSINNALQAKCSPENASNQIVKWTSSDPEIAEPVWNGTGACIVNAKKPGMALFTATAEDGGYKTYVEVCVTPTPESITLSETDVTIGVEQSFELSGKILPSEAYDWTYFKYDFDSDIIEREGGVLSNKIKITGKAVGETSITAYCGKNPELTEVCRITVVEPVYTETLALDQTEIEMFKSDTIKLNTIVSPSNITCKEIKWSSSNTNIVKVEDGVITYGGSNLIGEAVITAKAMDGSGKEAKCKVTVYGQYAQQEYPWAASASSDTVTLEVVKDCEYSMDKVNWQDSNVFTGLEADHEYTFYIRRKAKGYMKASEPSEGAVVRTSEFISSKDCTHSNTVIRNVIEPSCQECGYDGDTYCVVCRMKRSGGAMVPSLGHDYKSKVTKKATYTQDGIRTYTCSRCDDSYTEVILSIINGGTAEDNEEKDTETEAEPTLKPEDGTAESTDGTEEASKPGNEDEDAETEMGTGSPTATEESKTTADGNIYYWNTSMEQENETEKDTDNNSSTLKKGSKFNVGVCRYQITSSSAVKLVRLKSNKTAKLVIPKTVNYGTKIFKVTSIAKNALSKTKIIHVTIGSNVVTIGAGAFKNCKKLKTITIQSTKLKSVGKNALKGIKATAKIKVPAKKLKTYKMLLRKKGQGKKAKIVK